MNIYLGIFVFVAIASSIECGYGKTSKKNAFLNMLSGTTYNANGYSDKYFYSSLLELPREQAQKAVSDRDVEAGFSCPSLYIKCDPYSPWRTIDGSCNNLDFPWWGKSYTPYKRLLKAVYEDNDQPRMVGKSGYPLENPRTIALKVHYPKDIYIEISSIFTSFGQFVAHDISHFGLTTGPDGYPTKCKCAKYNHPDCINIPVPKYDYYAKDKACYPQVRSRAANEDVRCDTYGREQINEVTVWLDASQVYGNTDEDAAKLRTGYGGLLKTSEGNHLPLGCPKFTLCPNGCLNAGDGRVNQYPLLASMHTLFVREHNRIAYELWKMNPYWDDEFLYQMSRNIVIGEYQNIIFRDFLRVLIGEQMLDIFDLGTEEEGYFMEHKKEIFPQAANEFSAAAARYGHALIRPYETVLDEYNYVIANYSLWNVMFRPDHLLKDGAIEGWLRGAQYDKANWFSPHLTDYLSNFVKHDTGPHNQYNGNSLPTWNINRGRDHGLRGYNDYRPLAGLKKAKRWEDLTFIPKKAIDRLRSVYYSPDDIDLWTGIMSEYPLADGVVGPTAAYIIGRGFRDWKYADRWYFENGQDEQTKIPIYQLNELRKSSLARIICDNTDLKEIVPNVFFLESGDNYKVSCDSLPRVDLRAWIDYGKNGYKKN